MAVVVDATILFVLVAVSGAQLFDRVAFLLCAVAGTVAIHRLANVHATASTQGLLVVNWARSRRLDWAEVVAVRLAPGDPWVYLDVSDGTKRPVMGIQAADGSRGRSMALELAATVAAHGVGPGPGAEGSS
jgi:hypothetical protein